MAVDPFQLLDLPSNCDFATITAAHAGKCRQHPELKSLYDQALIELITAPRAITALGKSEVKADASSVPEPISPEQESEAATLWRHARRHQRQGNYEKALADLTRLVALQPDFAEAYFLRGLLYQGLNETRKALGDFGRTLQHNPEHVLGYLYRAKMYAELGRPDLALIDCTQALELDPDNVQVYLDRGWLRQQLHQQTEALEDYNKAIQLQPQLAQAYYNRGKLYAQLGQAKKAQKDFDRAIQLEQQQEEYRKEV